MPFSFEQRGLKLSLLPMKTCLYFSGCLHIRKTVYFFPLLIALFSLFSAHSTQDPSHSEVSQVELISPFQAAKKGQKIPIGFLFHLKPGWHTYWSYEGEVGKPLKVSWSLPEGVTLSSLPWPIPSRHEDKVSENKKIYSFIYEKEVLIPFQLKIPENYKSTTVHIKAHLEWLICKDVCLFRETSSSLEFPIAQNSPVISTDTKKLFNKWKAQNPKETTIKSHFETKNSKKWIYFQLEKSESCVDIYPLQPEDFSPAPPKRIQGKTGCTFETKGTLSQLPKISGLLLYKNQEGKTQGTLFTSRQKVPFSLLWFALMAFIGGLILNIMPCVLPVIFLKLYNTLELKGKTTKSLVWLNISYATGVISSFLLLALFIFISKTTGESIGWGFHLQSPVFVTLLSLLFLFMGFYLLGWVSLPIPKASLNFKGDKMFSHFLTGVLSTTAASPCTVPFMASAVGFAFSRNYLEIFIIFLFLGLGLSFPYLLLSAFPGFLKHLPSPGRWTEQLKTFFAFPLFATALWLFYLLFFQLNQKVFLITMVLIPVSVLFILSQRFFKTRTLKYILSAAFLVTLSVLIIFQKIGNTPSLHIKSPYPASLNVQTFSPDKITKGRESDDNIFIAFGAEWCLTCKFNERVFHNREIATFFKDHSISFYYGDWTNNNPLITKFLEKYEYKGVPFYILFKGSQETVIFPTLLTKKSFLKKLKSAFREEK